MVGVGNMELETMNSKRSVGVAWLLAGELGLEISLETLA